MRKVKKQQNMQKNRKFHKKASRAHAISCTRTVVPTYWYANRTYGAISM